jgi:hypothetical protein
VKEKEEEVSDFLVLVNDYIRNYEVMGVLKEIEGDSRRKVSGEDYFIFVLLGEV